VNGTQTVGGLKLEQLIILWSVKKIVEYDLKSTADIGFNMQEESADVRVVTE